MKIGDFGNAPEAMRIIDLFVLQVFRQKFRRPQLSSFTTQSRGKRTSSLVFPDALPWLFRAR
jgi:hypothetical protein